MTQADKYKRWMFGRHIRSYWYHRPSEIFHSPDCPRFPSIMCVGRDFERV